MVLPHDAFHERAPRGAAGAKARGRAADGFGDRVRGVAREGEAVRLCAVRVDITHRLREPADGVDDRDRPVAERDELPEAAGLESRGHEEEVASRVDALRERGVETEREPELARAPSREVFPLRLVRGIARAEDHELPTR